MPCSFRASVHGQPLDPAGNGFFRVVLTQRLAAGEAFLTGSTERNEFALFDFISLRLHELQEVVKVFGLRDSRVDGDFQFCFPALSLALGVPFGVGLALVLARLHNGQAVFLAQPVTGSADIGVAAPVGNVLALLYHIHGAKNDVVMQMALVYVGSQHIGVFALQHFVGKLPPDLMGLLRRGFARLKGLYQVVGQIVAFVERLRQQHLKFNVRRFVGTAKGRYQHFIVRLVRVFDVVKGPSCPGFRCSQGLLSDLP